MAERLYFANDSIHFFVTYSSKEDFERDMERVLSSQPDMVTLWSRRGNDCNYAPADFWYANGRLRPYVIQTMDEVFEGRDSSEFLLHTFVGLSSATNEQVDNRPIPRIFYLPAEACITPGQAVNEDTLYIHTEDKDLPVITIENV